MPASPPASADALESLIRDGLAELSLPADPAPALAQLCLLLEQWASRMSLTGHRDAEAIARRLVLDALALMTQLPEAASVVDLGSGAGFPGLPLAALRPSCRVTLVESRERRHHFQRAAVRELGLRNVEPLRGRAEALEATPHELAIAQAMAEPEKAARWLAAWVRPGGWIAIPGGVEAPVLPPIAGLAAPEVRVYQAPLGGPDRTLWLARRA